MGIQGVRKNNSSILVLMALCLSLSAFLGCAKKEAPAEPSTVGGESGELPPPEPDPVVVPVEVKTVIKNELFNYPELTTLLAVKDVPAAIAKIKEAGGKIVYDPNRGKGSAIGILVADLPPEKILDDEFIESLNLRAIRLQSEKLGQVVPQGTTPAQLTSLSVPTQEIGIDQLRALKQGRGLGENVLVGIIDTGIDASHPAFGDRVTYVQDMTREGDVYLNEATFEADGEEVKFNNDKKIKIPKILKTDAKVYAVYISEKQLSAQSKIDFDRNDIDTDVFTLVVGQLETTGDWIALIDANKDGEIKAADGETPILDFNSFRSRQRAGTAVDGLTGFVQFPSRNKTIKYPVLIHKKDDGEPEKVTVFADFGSHGTHVAGIVGGDGVGIQGAAPKVQFMAQKVCSDLTCTDEAILRGLVDAFYNPEGLIPDVINISLGSQQEYIADIYSYLARDLAAKFGTTFFISASNSGPGFRSINSLGHLGPIVSVGAHVSKETLLKHYDVNQLAGVPDHGVFGFSSAGPSYTGQLRPNIVAPGSAISATPLIDNATDMYNGTSMSSPLAAGGAAAMISLLKAEAETNAALKKAFDLKVQKAKDVRDGTENLKGLSLIDVPLALRNALEETAVPVTAQSVLRQGYGRIQVQNAVASLRASLLRFAQGEIGLTDFLINENNGEKPEDRLFDRTVDVASLKTIALALEDDGERGESSTITLLRNAPLTLKLKRVEVEKPDGTIEQRTTNMPFSIAVPGVEGQQATERTIVLGASQKSSFISIRDLSKMEAGNTYIAVYELYRGNDRLLTLTDLVQKPIELSNAVTSHLLSSFDEEPLKLPAAYSVAARKIGPNLNQRIPIAVRSGDSSLIVDVKIAAGEMGQVTVGLYNRDGKKVGESSARRSQQSPTGGDAKVAVETSGKPGIYEVVVSTSSGRWMGTTKYDMLVRASRFQVDKKKATLKTIESQADFDPVEVFSVTNTALQVKNVTAILSGAKRMESLAPFPVVPGRWTYKKLNIPEYDPTSSEPSTVDIVLKTGDEDEIDCLARIDKNLYTPKANGQGFDTAYSSKTLAFKNVARPRAGKTNKDLYVAVETFACALGTKKKSDPGLDIEAIFTNLPVPGMEQMEATVVKSEEVENNRYVIIVTAPVKLRVPDDGEPRVRARTTLIIAADPSELTESVQIDIVQ